MSPFASAASLAAPRGPFVAPCQDFERHTRRFRQRPQTFQMLARQNLGRGHHHALPACLDRGQQRHQRDQSFTRSNVALQQTIHAQRCCHIRDDLGDGAVLCAGRFVGRAAKTCALQRARGL